MRILIISQYFKPESFRINEVVESLVSLGYKITVITGKPNYPYGKIQKGYKPFKITIDQKDYLEIIRLPIIPRGQNSKIQLFFNYLSFIFSCTLLGLWKIRKKNFDIIYCYAPSPILQAIPGIIYSKISGKPFVLNVQDLWPESLSATNNINNKLVLNIIRKIVMKIYKNSNLILVSSKSFINSINKFVPQKKIKYFPNSVSSDFLHPKSIFSEEINAVFDKGFNCVFAGNLGEAQSIETIVEASELLRDLKNLKIVIIGDGKKLAWLKNQKNLKKLENLIILGWISNEKIPYILSKASCLLVSLKDHKIFKMTVPNKIQAYLAIGRPIIGSIGGEAAEIIQESKSGIVCKPENSDLLSKAIRKLYSSSEKDLNKMSTNGRNYFLSHFEHNQLIELLEEHFKDLIR